MWILIQSIFMFLIVTGLISIDKSLKKQIKNDKLIIEQLNKLIIDDKKLD